MKKSLPKLKSDAAARKFLKGDLSDYIGSENFYFTTFEFAPKNKSITLRISESLLKALRSVAKQEGTNYQRVVRQAIEQFLRKQTA